MISSRWPFIEPERARSVPVQLGLLAATFVGALGLAVVALCLRSLFFERYVRETYAPSTENSEVLISRLEHPKVDKDQPRGKTGNDLPVIDPAPDRREVAEWDALYGLWMNPSPDAPDEERLQRLLWSRPEATLERVRTTSVVGNPAQRARALELLSSVPASPVRDDAVELSRFVRERARRRGDRALFIRADQICKLLSRHI